MNLVVDIGNTRCKVGLFEKDKLINKIIIEKNQLVSALSKILVDNSIERAIISTVADLSDSELTELKGLHDFVVLSHSLSFPFKNNYETPKTLGVDRLALITAASHQFPSQNTLVIDAGTCITYDILTKDHIYLGGAISPGITMRFKAMNQFTSKLPLYTPEILEDYIGNSTKNAINSGVVNGVIQEIDAVINQYQSNFPNLTVVLTGGDTNFLGKQLKSSIFANRNFLLEGLNAVLIYN